ncbi:MAG: hypothetical protein COA94_04995 [Rickettsiales bacterium]|nr:MAG: hypothetical protein COA94_04995 [Rickettsiales bacterium]
MSVKIRNHKDDPDMLEVYSIDWRGEFTLWGSVHFDILTEFEVEITKDDLDNMERDLCIKEGK